MIFSEAAGWMIDANLADVLAIWEAMILFASSFWTASCGVIIESDSKNAVTWVSKPDTAPWRLRNIVLLIRHLMEKMGRWQVKHILRSDDEVAVRLVKQGVLRCTDLLQVFP
ncbi:Uncharacterized protein TCM_008262 [Theobroma cacao]|uniref:RNase H type-1 domain-containing protein n=1 Tax=Theobroma cacao TaxID=3641 RepID=A0A061E4K6_THECC|nr:Uncharacterized protein TCM_008262 [Theobroma cacao]